MDLQFTAIFRKVPEGYIGFVEELPSRPSMSGQYSSAFAVRSAGIEDRASSPSPRSIAASVTSRLIAFERTWLRSLWSPVTTVPSGSLIRTADPWGLLADRSMKFAAKANRVGH